MKKFVLKVLFKLHFLGRIHRGLKVMNFITQRVLRVNAKMKVGVHFTSRIITADKISFEKDENTLASFAHSGCCYIQANNGINLGRNILFSKGLNLISGNHNKLDYTKWDEADPIRIGNDVLIGVNVTILPGVQIGDNCIIGAGSVVCKSFSKNLTIVGNPAKALIDINV